MARGQLIRRRASSGIHARGCFSGDNKTDALQWFSASAADYIGDKVGRREGLRLRIILRELEQASPVMQSVFAAIVDGLGEKEIAARMGCSHHTVHSHIKRIYRLANVTSHRELMAIVAQRLAERLARPGDAAGDGQEEEPLVL